MNVTNLKQVLKSRNKPQAIMSKEIGFVETPAEHSDFPSAPPSYDEAMQQAGAAYMPMPGSHGMPQPMSMTPSAPPSMPIPTYTGASQVHAPQPTLPVYPHPIQAPAQAPSTIIITNVALGRERCFMTCHKCNAQVLTETVEENQCMAHIWCCLLLFLCPCCSCIPYCMDACKMVKHNCPNCHAHLGVYKP